MRLGPTSRCSSPLWTLGGDHTLKHKAKWSLRSLKQRLCGEFERRDRHESPADSLRRPIKVKSVSVLFHVPNTSLTFHKTQLYTSRRLQRGSVLSGGGEVEPLVGNAQGQPRAKLSWLDLLSIT